MGGGLVEGAGERDGAAEGAGEALVGSREVGGGGGGGRGLGSGGLGGLLREGAGEGGADLDQLVQDRAVVGRVRVALGRAGVVMAGSGWEGAGDIGEDRRVSRRGRQGLVGWRRPGPP